jgi:Sulfotransferase family
VNQQGIDGRGPSPRASAASRPIVVGGCLRTGTSLVRRILDSHSRIHCGPEVKFFRDFFGNYFDDPLKHLRFFQSARSLLDEGELLNVAGAAFVEMHERAAHAAGKPRWADKNPENVLYLDAWQRLLGDDWLFVHVVRNPLDTLASIADVGFPLSVPKGLPERIDLYLAYTAAGLRFAEQHPGRSQLVVYEQLVSDPEHVARELMRRLGEELEPAQLAFNDQPHEPGLEDPKVAGTRSVHRASVNRWREALDTDEAVRIWASTAQLWRGIDPELEHVSPPPAVPV